MISELSSLLSQADAALARSGGHKFSVNMNRNRIRSISAYSSNSIFYFPTIVSDQATPEEVTMVSRFLEKAYASFVVACIGLMPFHRIKADDQASIEEYLAQFHQNLGVKNGNGAAIYKAMNAASRLSESITAEDLAITQDYLQECWDTSRASGQDYITVVNESIKSLNEQFNKDAVDSITRTLQESYKATLREMDDWGFLGEATVDMNLWDDLESLSDEELAQMIDPYNAETIGDFDDDADLEDEYPELDAVLEDASWESIYNKAKETMSNSDAVKYANEQFAKLKDKAAQAKEVAVQKTKDLGDHAKSMGTRIKSQAEKLDDKVKEKADEIKNAIDKRIIKEATYAENTGALDQHNKQVAADEERHDADDAAKRRTMAANARTAVEQMKAATAQAKEQRKQAEFDAKQRKEEEQAAAAANEAVGSVMLTAKINAAKAKLQQARENGESQERVATAQAAVDNQRVQNQKALSTPEGAEARNNPHSPAQMAAAQAKAKADQARQAAMPKEEAPDANRVAYAANAPVQEAASMGQAIESIKFSMQSVSADKINGCKSIAQLDKLDKKLKTLRARYNSYLNRYKHKAEDEGKKGNKVLAKLHSVTVGDPKAFMLQYGNYIREINARIEMIRRRKKALSSEIGNDVNEDAFATITDMDLAAIDYCITEATKMVEAPDEEVFDVIVDDVDDGVVDEAANQLNEAKSFGERYEALIKQYNHILERTVKNKRFLLCLKIGSNNRKLTGWTGKGGIIPSAMNDEDLAKLEEFIVKRNETGLFLVPDAYDGYYNDTADLIDLILKRRQVLHQMGMASQESTIPQDVIEKARQEREDYLKKAKNAAAERREQELRLRELDIKQQEADVKKSLGVAATAAAATYALNSLASKNENAVINEAKDKDKDFSYIGTAKKATSAIKDVYDIIDNERKRAEDKDKLKFTKEPKASDPKDKALYYQNNRQLGGLNVAAAANAKEMTYQGHKTFDREVFSNMEMKKANEAIPTFAKATIGFIVDETEQVVTRDVLIGCKVNIHAIRSGDLVNDLYNTIINKRKFLKFIRFATFEERSLVDLLFGIKEMKLDAVATRKSDAARWLPAFRRRKRISAISTPYLMRDYTPNGTIVMTQQEVNVIKDQFGIDILRADHVKMLMEANFLLGFVILDQANEICRVIYDGQSDFEQFSYAALRREEQSQDKMLRELYRSISR